MREGREIEQEIIMGLRKGSEVSDQSKCGQERRCGRLRCCGAKIHDNVSSWVKKLCNFIKNKTNSPFFTYSANNGLAQGVGGVRSSEVWSKGEIWLMSVLRCKNTLPSEILVKKSV